MPEVPPFTARAPARALATLLVLPISIGAGAARAQDPPKPASVAWTVLKPAKLASTGGATLTPQPDGSIVVAGKSAEKDEYRLEFDCDLATVTGFKLEALADPALPQSGPGRATNGNFVLNELKIEAGSKLQRRFRPVALENASADFIENGRWPGQVCDSIEDVGGNGWAVYGAVGRHHELVVEAHSDVKFDAG